MPRRVQDIIPADHRSIREISVPGRSKSRNIKSKELPKEAENDRPIIREEILPRSIRNKFEIREKESEDLPTNKSSLPPRRMPITPPFSERKPRRGLNKWLVIVILVILGISLAGYFASVYYSRATFTITPKVIPLSVNGTYVAQSGSQNTGLFYEIISLTESATTTAPSTNGPVTNTKATGKITLYNSFSNQSIRLIAGTRLSGESGLVYRLSSSVIIPGYTKSGNTISPGKLTTSIIADQAGQNYNIPLNSKPVDFKIVAYSGSSRYTTVYATQSTAISGGYSGAKKIISSTAMASSTDSLKAKITEELLSKAKSSVPDGFVLYDKNYTISFGSVNIGGQSSNTADISLQGTINAVVLPKNKLAEALAGPQAIALFEPFTYTSPGLETLSVNINNIKDFAPNKKTALVLGVKGEMKIVGTVPIEEIRKKLSGIPLAQTQDVFKSYSAVIEKGEGELAPPWANIPTDPNRVKIVIQEP